MISRILLLLLLMITHTHQALGLSPLAKSLFTNNKERSWDDIFDATKASILKVISYSGTYDPLKPYQTPRVSMGRGTGFFISDAENANNLIVTNYHVIENALSCCVEHPFFTGQYFKATIIGVHPERDLAIIRLEKDDALKLLNKLNIKSFPALTLGESSSLKPTAKMMLCGYPLGDDLKISLGECSGFYYLENYGNLVQTTVPTNRGNSGGPYFNSKGEVVGICALGYNHAEADGIAYVITTETLKNNLESMKQHLVTRNPLWGMQTMTTTHHTSRYLKAPTDGGSIVTSVTINSLADKADIRIGDIILRINHLIVNNYGYITLQPETPPITLHDYLSRLKTGDTVTIEIYRAGECLTKKIMIQECTELAIKTYCPFLEEPLDYEIIGGLVITPLTNYHIITGLNNRGKNLLKYLDDKHKMEPRIAISAILPSSPADELHIFEESSLVIKKVQGIEVNNITHLREIIQTNRNNPYLTVETEDHKLLVLSVDEIVAQEAILAQRYGYKPSALINLLAESSALA